MEEIKNTVSTMMKKQSLKPTTNGKMKSLNTHSKNDYVCDICKDTTWIFDEEGQVTRCECFETYLQEIKMKRLKMPAEFQGKYLKHFKTTPYKDNEKIKEYVKMANSYLKNLDKYKGKGFYIYSGTKGSGKTYMLAIIGNELLKRGQAVRFARTTEILDLIKESYNDPSEKTKDILKGLVEIEYLLIDDIGAERATDWVNEQFTYIIDKRMTTNKTTMFTSNETVKDLNLNDRIINRINRITIKMKFPEISVRDILADFEEKKLTQELLKE